MPFIEFGYVKKSHLLLLIFPVFQLLNSLCFYNKEIPKVFKSILYFASQFLVGLIGEIFQFYKDKKKIKKNKRISSILIFEENKVLKKNRIIYGTIFFLLILIDQILFNIIQNYMEDDKYDKYEFLGIGITFICIVILMKAIFKKNLYNYQILSSSIILIDEVITVLILQFCTHGSKYFERKHIVLYIVLIIRSITNALFFVFIKIIMELHFYTLYKILLLNGLFGLIIVLSCFFTYIIKNKHFSNGFLNKIFDICYNFKGKELQIFYDFKTYLLIFSYFITCIISRFSFLVIIKIFDPSFIIISYIIYNIVGFFINNNNISWICYIIIAIYVFDIINALIYNEIIILKFCKLDEYTKKEINLRANEEMEGFSTLKELLEGNVDNNKELDNVSDEKEDLHNYYI